jgi:precorrin-8X/cobalt-precorrin-8 methylmutase
VSLVQKYALTPKEIDRESMRMVSESLPESLDMGGDELYVVSRIVRAEGDPLISLDVRMSPGAVQIGIAALKDQADVITDVRMVEHGISKALLRSRGINTLCRIDTPETAARAQREGTTRSIAAIRQLAQHLNGSVVAVGNAPTALLALLDLVHEGSVSPRLIIGMPVGFVACAESKDELTQGPTPYITVTGRRGGSSAAAATVNALLSLMTESPSP